MKFQKNTKYTTIAVYAVILSVCIILCLYIFLNFDGIDALFQTLRTVFRPIEYGFLFAFLLNPLMKVFENRVLHGISKKKPRKKLRRILAVVIVYLLVLSFLAASVMIIIPQISKGYNDLISQMSYYINNVQNLLSSWGSDTEGDGSQYGNFVRVLKDAVEDFSNLIQQAVPHILDFLHAFYTETKNIFLGLILSVYFLLSKETAIAQIKKFFRAFCSNNVYAFLMNIASNAKKIFGDFFINNMVDSLIVGLLCYIFMTLTGLPYAPLIGLIVGVTNLIPFVGPIVGFLIGTFITFIHSPWSALWFILLMIGLQLFDGYIIMPKVVGSKKRLSQEWILLAVILMGGLWGFTGLLIGVPLFTLISIEIEELVNGRLRKKNLPEKTLLYYGDDFKKEENLPQNSQEVIDERKNDASRNRIITSAIAEIKHRKNQEKDKK